MSGVAVSVSIGLAAAVLMIRIGLAQRALDPRRSARSCGSCGREYRGRFCPWCAG